MPELPRHNSLSSPFSVAQVLMWNKTSQPELGYSHDLLEEDSRH